MESSFRGAWLLRPYVNEDLRIESFRIGDFIGIGWQKVGPCDNLSKTQLRTILIEQYSLNGVKLGNAMLCFEIFMKMKIGDLVLLPTGIDEIDILCTGKPNPHINTYELKNVEYLLRH